MEICKCGFRGDGSVLYGLSVSLSVLIEVFVRGVFCLVNDAKALTKRRCRCEIPVLGGGKVKSEGGAYRKGANQDRSITYRQ